VVHTLSLTATEVRRPFDKTQTGPPHDGGPHDFACGVVLIPNPIVIATLEYMVVSWERQRDGFGPDEVERSASLSCCLNTSQPAHNLPLLINNIQSFFPFFLPS